MCTAPGDGTLRKAPDLWRRWSDGLGLGVHRAQLNILQRGLQMLKPGGRLVYSTCSMNPIEDEAVVAHAISALGPQNFFLVDVSHELPALKRRAGVATWRVRADEQWYEAFEQVPPKLAAAKKLMPSMFALPPDEAAALNLERCMRVLPHDQDTGGFFIAVLRRSDTPAAPPPAKSDGTAAGTSAATSADGGSGAAKGLGADTSVDVQPSLQSWPTTPAAVAASAAPAGVSKSVRPGDWTCPQCFLNVFAVKTACFKCGTPKPTGLEVAAPAAGGATGADDEAAEGDAEAEGAGTSSAAGAGPPLVSRIAQQRHQQPGAHVLAALHCSPRNNGKYDALYVLTPAWHAELASFLGLRANFPSDQLVTRSVGGKGARRALRPHTRVDVHMLTSARHVM